MALAKYWYHYLKDKLVICPFIGRSFHQGIFLHTLWCREGLFVLPGVVSAKPYCFERRRSTLGFGGFLRSKQAVSIGSVYGCGCPGYRFHGFVNHLSYLQGVSLSMDLLGNVSLWCRGVYHYSSTCVDTLEALSASHILAYAISSRPDLFVAVHDVSLMTPTQKGRLMAATTDMADVYLLWVERDGAL
ncbi:predicted protein [Lichtheimia corymbifera JMRC:FSU:9682]|uniref:Uncharacterized protein n=1 Tax=Lichtheimia corymbifera JMRC:FSU:9682 TaxID=1263082 RepID=A0A068SD92_9FUNG|nr:predicted protein [Lichtheimia corymbifera JMRC:FSU:9682]